MFSRKIIEFTKSLYRSHQNGQTFLVSMHVDGGEVDTVADIVEGLGEARMDIIHTVRVAGELASLVIGL